jgi:hypothetical protein
MSPKIPYTNNNSLRQSQNYGIVSHKQSNSGKLQQVKGGNGSVSAQSSGGISRASNNNNKMTGSAGNN